MKLISEYFLSALILCLVGVRESSAAQNEVSKVVSSLLDKIANEGLSVPLINLGSQKNRLEDVKGNFSKDMEKQVDGDGLLGLKLTLKAKNFSAIGQYDIEKLDLPGLFPIFGKGKFSVILNDLDFKLNIKPTKNFTTGNFDMKVKSNASMDTSKIFFENLMDDPKMADFLNELLSSLLPDLVKVFQNKLIEDLQPTINYVGSEIIRCVKTELVSGRLEECIRNITWPAPNLSPEGVWTHDGALIQ